MINAVYSDFRRPPLHEAALRRALLVPGGLWSDLRVVGQTGSTNADLAAAARSGAAEGTVLVAERQISGRGRLDRVWTCPPRAGLAVSVLLRPGQARSGWPAVEPDRYGWLPLLVGVALVDAVRRVAGVDAALKWPNDLLIDGRKCAGILAEAVLPQPAADPAGTGAALVVGVGLNVTVEQHELPYPMATSLAMAGAAGTDRDPLLRALLREVAEHYVLWRHAGGDATACGLRERYQECTATVGEQVRVMLPGDRLLVGRATGVDQSGRLEVLDQAGSTTAVAVGDVIHVR